MANHFINTSARNVGTSWEIIYECPVNTTSIIIGASIANIHSASVTCQARVYDNDAGGVYGDCVSPNTPIDIGGTLVPYGGSQKLVLEAGDKFEVRSDTLDSLDCILNILEIGDGTTFVLPPVQLWFGDIGIIFDSDTVGINVIDINTSANATLFGDLLAARSEFGGASNSINGVFGGGWVGGYSLTMETLTFASAGNSTSYGNLSQNRVRFQGSCDGTIAVFCGGWDGASMDEMSSMIMNTETTDTNFGTLMYARAYVATFSSISQAFAVGGYGYTINIEVTNYSSLANSTLFGDLTRSKLTGSNTSSNETYALVGGGAYNTTVADRLSEIDCITMTSASNATNFGDLAVGCRDGMGTGNGTVAIFSGGMTTANTTANTIEETAYNTTGTTTSFGDLLADSKSTIGLSGN